MVEYKKGSHTVYDIKYHFVWVTKYRYKVLEKIVGERLRELMRQGCQTMRVTIVKGSIVKDHVHLLVSCPIFKRALIQILIQEEFPILKKRYVVNICGQLATFVEQLDW
jgi:putative transposase